MDRKKDMSSLLVFGYACRIYEGQSDDVAEKIGGSKYLIPWNGNEDLKIDRYDCRLYLSSLSEFENESQQAPTDDSSEMLEEELCDEERYRDLDELEDNCFDTNNGLDASSNQLSNQSQRATIGFNYGVTEAPDSQPKIFNLEIDTDSLDPYTVPEGLKLPVGIGMPETAKQGAIIEKTALFVSTNGAQMEVVFKAKFGTSPLFGFLDFDHKLHPFYKYLSKQIREKKYIPKTIEVEKPKLVKQEESEESDEGDELHPLLTGGATVKESIPDRNSGESKLYGPEFRRQEKPKLQIENPPVDLQTLVHHFHSDKKDSLYTSLMSRLHSVIPGGTKVETEKVKEEESSAKKEAAQQEFETDELKIESYNQWHMEFYGRPSPYLPLPPPKVIPPPPNLSSSISLASRYVALNGPAAEQRLIDHNGESIDFLFPRSLHYTYYQSRIRAVQETLLNPQGWVFQLQQQQQQQQTVPPVTVSEARYTQSHLTNSTKDPNLVPIEMPVGQRDNPTTATEPTTSGDDLKQKERREKARLFMEKILNDKAKKRLGAELDASLLHQQKESTPSIIEVPQSAKKISDDTISSLIDKQLQKVLLSASTHRVDEVQSSEKHKRKKRSKRSSRSHSHSSGDSYEGHRKHRQRKKHRRRSRSRERSRRSKSRSASKEYSLKNRSRSRS